MTEPQPTAEEATRLLAAHKTLAKHGVAARGGYDLSLLAAAIYARGWSYRIDRADGDFRATIARARDDQRQLQATANGWSMDAALAFALVEALGPAPLGRPGAQ